MAFENIFTHGSLVDICVGIWTGTRQLQAEDLGLAEDKISEAFSLGHKNLIPYEVIAKFKNLDYKARYLLTKYSFPFEFGSARFVPKKRLLDFVTDIDLVIDEFNKAADDLVANYGRYRIEMRQQFVAAAHAAYTRMKQLHGFVKSEDEFVNTFIERVEKFYPDSSKIREKFHMEYTVFQVALPDLSQANYADIAEENEKLQMLQLAYQKSLTRKVESFVERLTTDQRSRAQETLNRFSALLESDKRISEQSMDAVKNMITDFEHMDIVGDEGFLSMLKNFKMRVLDVYSAKDIKGNSKLRRSIIDEVAIVLGVVSDKAVITEIAAKYRERINL
jgi:hypothetical protein